MKNEISPKKYAKTAGLFYLLIAIIGGFSIGYVPSVIIVSDDAAQTIKNLEDHQLLFGFGIVADIAVFLMELILTIILYRILRPVNKTLSMVALFSRMAMGVVMGINLLFYIAPQVLLSNSVNSDVFSQGQLESLVLFFFDMHQYGIYIWGLFFALHLIVLGYLVAKSTFFPKIIGTLMTVGSIGYLGESILAFVLPDYSGLSMVVAVFLTISVIGELGFTFWLLIKGLDEDKWKRRIS